jgi:two-component system, LuxR family, sensor kinase FixL
MIRRSVDGIQRPVGDKRVKVCRHQLDAGGFDADWLVQFCYRITDTAGVVSQRLPAGSALAGLLVCVGYFCGAKLGFALTLTSQPVSLLWPPNSILLAGLLLTPVRSWWFVTLAAFPAHWASQFQSNVPIPMMLCWFISNSFEALVGAWCIRKLNRDSIRFDNFRAVGIFIAFGVFLAPFLSSFLDAAFVAMNGWGQSGYWEVWRIRFLSNAMAAMTLVTVIVSWATDRMKWASNLRPVRIAEASVLIAGLLGTGLLIFIFPDTGAGRRPVLLYTPLPFLLWAAVRFGFTGLSTAILAVVLMGIWGTAHGQGPFSSRSPLENALSLQLFLIVVSIPLFCLAAVLQGCRKTEEALRGSEARYREVVETQTDLICRFLPDTTLTFVNEAYCRLFLRDRDELIGMQFISFIPEATHLKTLEHFASLANNPSAETVEHEVLLPDGTLAWHQWVNRPILKNGRVREFQAIGRDITDRKRAEAATEKLTHVSRLAIVGEMTASIIHEITQPLGAILSNADAGEMLLEGGSSNLEDVKHIFADIRKDDVRASEVIRHIRSLLRRSLIEMQPVDVNAIVSETIGFVDAEVRRREMLCELQLGSALPKVKGDPTELKQVLLNLVLNGMEAMRETPKARRRLRLTTGYTLGGGVYVLVRDFGTGISPDRLLSLFEPFSTSKEDGMGLGLSISKTIIDTHHGRIFGENSSDGGATFGFVLPAMEVASINSSGTNLCPQPRSQR